VQARDLHFITFTCYRRQSPLASAHAKQLIERAPERARRGPGPALFDGGLESNEGVRAALRRL